MSVEISQPTENPVPMKVEEKSEEYAYLDKCGFTSELYKIEVKGLPKFYGFAEIKKFMKFKLGLQAGKIKRSQHGYNWIYVCFQNNEERQKALSALNGCRWKGKVLTAEEATPAPDPLVRKRKLDEAHGDPKKKLKTDKDKSQEERLKDATTPLWNMPYDEQLKLKEDNIRTLMTKVDNELWKRCPLRRNIIEENRKKYNGLSFILHPIERSPKTTGYRNKCEFTVSLDEETKLPTVGFRLGSYVDGQLSVAPVNSLMHISERTKNVVLLFQKLIRSLPYEPFSPFEYTGHWKYVTIRESMATQEIMAIVTFHPQQLLKEDMDDLRKKLIAHFSSDEAKACNIKSLYLDVIRVRRPGQGAELLMGETHITDTILGKQFRISPEAFFQVNTAGASILYKKAIDMCKIKRSSTVVDICCGTGSIGLCFAEHCYKVLGLEKVPAAVKDAKANAVLNNINNCDFFTGSAEEILGIVLGRATGDDVVAIVDPPRAGLHMRAVLQLRNSKKVNRLIYMSCSPESAFANFVNLTRPCSKTLRGAPFVPVQAVPVDMFPQTKHVELVVLFVRDNTDYSAAKEDNADAAGKSSTVDVNGAEK